MSVRLDALGGANLTPGATTQDFVLNSHPVMMAADTRGFMELLQANEAGGLRRTLYFLTHPKALRIGLAARTNPTCHLDLAYWSTTPYLFGPGRAVKYMVDPDVDPPERAAESLDGGVPPRRHAARLSESEATFDFMIQFQSDSSADADRRRVRRSGKQQDSPYIPVARIRIPPQPVDDPVRVAACERLAFNPWHCRPEHRPLGGMNRARRDIYKAMAAYRDGVAPV